MVFYYTEKKKSDKNIVELYRIFVFIVHLAEINDFSPNIDIVIDIYLALRVTSIYI